MLKRDDIDLVVIATPWNWHTPMAVAAMKDGKHVAVEVPAARTLDECWDLVNTSEPTRRHCIQLENCCYGYNEMLVLNMVRAGVFGELTHGGAAYNHDLRSILFSEQWRRPVAPRRALQTQRQPLPDARPRPGGALHGRQSRRPLRLPGLDELDLGGACRPTATSILAADDPRQKETYKEGDLNISLIRTVKGRMITLEHNVTSPQPYDRINLIAGTKGIFRDYPPRIYIDGAEREEFESHRRLQGQVRAPRCGRRWASWRRKLGGHGGMDFVMATGWRSASRQGLAPDIDVYDAAAWSAPVPLSEQSVAKGSAPHEVPGFHPREMADAAAGVVT